MLDGPVGPLENGHQRLVLGQGVPVGGGTGLYGAGGLLLFLLLGSPGQPLPPGQHAGQVHMSWDFVPAHGKAGPVAAEYGIGGVLQVPLDVVPGGGHHLGGVVAGEVPRRQAGELPPAPGVGRHLPGVAPQAGHRGLSHKHRLLPLGDRGLEFPAQPGHVRQGPAQGGLGHPQGEPVPGLQQHAQPLGLGGAQPLAHRPVGGLAEVPALGVLQVGPARRQGEGHVGEGRAHEGPDVGLFPQVGEDEPLPVPGQVVLPAGGGQVDAAPRRGGLQEQVDLGVVAQGLVVAHPLHPAGDGLFVEDAPLAKLYPQAEAPLQQALEHLQLHLAHKLQVELPQPLVPHHVEQGVLLLQLP